MTANNLRAGDEVVTLPRQERAVSARTVLVLPAWYPTEAQPLAGPFVRDHARAAAMFGHDMVVFAEDSPRANMRGLFELVTEQDGALTVVRFAARPAWRRFVYGPALLLLARRLAAQGRSVSVLHAHVHWMGWAAVPLGSALRRPVVISEHSTEWPGKTMKKGALQLARFTFSRAALVCPVSEALQGAIEAYGIRARFRVVSNPVDTSVFYPGELLPTDQPTRLVNVALHEPKKGLDVLLRAMKLLITRRPELTLDLVGEGPLTPELQRLTAELALEDHVRFLGPMDSAGVADALREAHVFVLSSLVETQGVAVIEALCCGLAVAATRAPGVSEVVGDADESVLVQPNDPDALAAAIETLLDRYPKLDRVGSARRAAERFSLEAVGRVWDEIYRSF